MEYGSAEVRSTEDNKDPAGHAFCGVFVYGNFVKFIVDKINKICYILRSFFKRSTAGASSSTRIALITEHLVGGEE